MQDRILLSDEGVKKEEREKLNLISKDGLRSNFWNYVQRVAGERSLKRFLYQRFMLGFFIWLPTILGSVIRGVAYKALLGGIGKNCIIEKNVHFFVPKKIFLGDRVFIGENSRIDGGSLEGGIEIKNDVYIGQYCFLKTFRGKININESVNIGTFSQIRGSGDVEIGKNSLLANNIQVIGLEHIYKDPSTPIKFQGADIKKVKIGEDVWLGASVIVLAGVTIGEGVVIGAGSIVVKDIPPYNIAVGNPARVIRKRE